MDTVAERKKAKIDKGGSDRYFHSIFGQNDLARKFPAAFGKNVMTLKDGVEVSQEEFLARGLPRDLPCKSGSKVAFRFSFIGERAL